MKKFIVFSILVAVAAITVGIIRQQADGPETAVTAAAEITTTTAAASPSTSSTTVTTARKTAIKAALQSTMTTRPAAAGSSPTTVATAPTTTTMPVAPTTTITSVATVTPTCTVVADNPSVSKGGSQTIRVTSNMPATKVKIEMAYPKFGTGKPNPRQTYNPTTDAAGSVIQTFVVSDWSTAPVTVLIQFYGPSGAFLGGPACRTSFMSTES